MAVEERRTERWVARVAFCVKVRSELSSLNGEGDHLNHRDGVCITCGLNDTGDSHVNPLALEMDI